MNNSQEKKMLISILTGFVIILFVAVGFAITRNSGMNTDPVISESESQGEKDTAAQSIAVIKKIDSESSLITIYDIDSKLEHILTYNGGTEVLNRYNKHITMKEVKVGEMAAVSFTASDSALKKLVITNKAWESTKITKYKVDGENSMITIANKNYKLSPHLFIASNGEAIDLMDLNEKDELTIKGIDKTVYSIIVTRGHGYIRLKNYDDFIGGNIEVGYDVLVPISKDMLIVAREGEYRVLLKNNSLEAVKNISVIRDQEVVMDMKDYHLQSKQMGAVTFKVLPDGADLYVDGKQTDYSKAVNLTYGTHKVEASLTGYTTYTGTLEVSEAKQTVKIHLKDESETDPNATTTPTPAPSTENSESGTTATPAPTATPTPETKMDYSHKITITTPEGAEVYLNGTYKGVAPISMVKEIGTHTVSLRKTGFETKSYTIQVSDDNKDITFTFPDLEASKN